MMDYLPEVAGQLLLLSPSILPGRAFFDRMGRFRCETPDAHTLRLVGRLPAGRYQMRMLTRSGGFDVDSCLLPLVEWPTQRTVMAGPFDFDHTQYRMAVPTFRVTVNGRSLGLVWCEVPSPEDMAARRIRALWGVEVSGHGEAVIELSVSPEDRGRLHWADLAEMELVADDRYSLRLPASVSRRPQHPRILADAATFGRIRGHPDPVSQTLRRRLVQLAESGRDGTYAFRTLALALLARIGDDPRWAQEAIARAMALVGKTDWGYHSAPEIMGWNNDRDAGNRMFELAVVLDWLYDRLDEEQRRQIIAKLAWHADIAYRVTLLQKNYWYHRCVEAHGQGLWCGLAATAAALLGHDRRARRWLEWTLGGFDDAARHLQADGISTWFVFNISWHVYTLAVLESVLGRPFPDDFPFFRNFSSRVLQVVNPDAVEPTLGCHLLFLARRHRCGSTQADALRLLGLSAPGSEDRHPRAVHSLALLFFDPDLTPGQPHPIHPAVCAERGVVACRGRNGSRFMFCCGTGATAAQHAAHNFINRTWYGPAHSGSFYWAVDWADEEGMAQSLAFQPEMLPGYRSATVNANLVSIDERGHFLEGRWLGSTLPLRRVSFLEHCAGDGQVTYACGNSSHACADDLDVRLLTREWIFLHDSGVVVMRDRVRTAQARQFAWHLHGTRDPWQSAGPMGYSLASGDHRLFVRALATSVDDLPGCALVDAVVAEIAQPRFVPPYTMGLNLYKTLDWQPELRPKTIDIPPYPDLQFHPRSAARSWELVTAMAVDVPLDSLTAEAGPAGLRVCGLPAGGEVLWPRNDGLLTLDAERHLVAAAAVRPDASAAWRIFHATRWSPADRDGVEPAAPADLLWPVAGLPHPMVRVTAMPNAVEKPIVGGT